MEKENKKVCRGREWKEKDEVGVGWGRGLFEIEIVARP